MSKKLEVKIGDKFGSYEVVDLGHSIRMPSGWKRMIKCQCKCGRINEVQLNNLIKRTGQRCRNCAARLKNIKEHSGIVNKKCLYGAYRSKAKKRNMVFDLSFEYFVDLATRRCFYCNIEPSNFYELRYSQGHRKGELRCGPGFYYNGIDRVDSQKGYTLENCVSCCFDCNYAKETKTIEQLKIWVTRLYKHFVEKDDAQLLPRFI